MLIALGAYLTSEGGQATSVALNTPQDKYLPEESSRVLNHWEKVGVIRDRRKDGKGWRKLSFMDAIWIQIVFELRSINFPLDKIATLRNHLEQETNSESVSRMPILELYVRHSLIKFQPFYLIVYANGKGDVGFKGEIEASKEFGFIGTHISINLNQVVKAVAPDAGKQMEFSRETSLSKSEEEFLAMLRSGAYKEFSIRTKNGATQHLEASEVLKDPAKFAELAAQYPFQDIKHTVRDGKIRSVTRTVKKKY